MGENLFNHGYPAPFVFSFLKKEFPLKKRELDKKFIYGWAKKNDAISILEVAGDIASGTIVAGEFSFEEVKKINNVSITEVPVKGSDPKEWAMDIKKLK